MKVATQRAQSKTLVLSCCVWDQGEMGRGKPLALTCGVGSALLSLGSADGAFPTLELAGNGISIVLLIFTILEFCIAVATANFWCRATRLSSNEVRGAKRGGSTPAGLSADPFLSLPRPC